MAGSNVIYVAKKHINLCALIYFHEEKKFSVLRLKDVASDSLPFQEDFDFGSWIPSRKVEVMWNNESYPANILQFGENKKQMDQVIDGLVDGSLKPEDVPVLQINDVGQNRKREKHEGKAQHNVTKLQGNLGIKKKSKKLPNVENFFIDVRKKMKEKGNKECNSCIGLQKLGEEARSELQNVKEHLSETNAILINVKEKYSNLKRKYKEKKRELKAYKDTPPCPMTTIGPNVDIPTAKLALCRSTDYSKYVGDLLEVYYGREILAESLLKGIRKNSLKYNILDSNVTDEITAHVVQKFGVPLNCVRSSIRQKLNTCHKLRKRIENLKVLA